MHYPVNKLKNMRRNMKAFNTRTPSLNSVNNATIGFNKATKRRNFSNKVVNR